MSGLPWAWASRSRAMCSLRQALWNADLAFSSCHKHTHIMLESCRPGVSTAHSIHSFSKMYYSIINIFKHLYVHFFLSPMYKKMREMLTPELQCLHYLLQSLGPGFLSTWETSFKILGLLETSKYLLMESVLLPRPDAISILWHQSTTDGGVQQGKAVGRREEALPCS